MIQSIIELLSFHPSIKATESPLNGAFDHDLEAAGSSLLPRWSVVWLGRLIHHLNFLVGLAFPLNFINSSATTG